MQDQEIIVLIFGAMLAILLIALGAVSIFILFYKSRKKLLIEKQEKELQYLQELSKTKSEIQDQTLNHIARELHDNVGQLLAVAKIHTNALVSQNLSPKINEIDNALTQSIDKVRSISRSLNMDRINEFGFIPAIKSEVERIKKLDIFIVKENIDTTNQFKINADTEIMLYRMVQEFISNTLKYAQAKNLELKINYSNNDLQIFISDDGIGFNEDEVSKGSGMFNIQNRAKLIGAEIEYNSALNEGTKLSITFSKTEIE